jgi:hypothetical protein
MGGDLYSADQDNFSPSAPSTNSLPTDRPFGNKKGFGMTATKVKGATKLPSFGKMTLGTGTRKSTAAPKGAGVKGQTTKSNALKGA